MTIAVLTSITICPHWWILKAMHISSFIHPLLIGFLYHIRSALHKWSNMFTPLSTCIENAVHLIRQLANQADPNKPYVNGLHSISDCATWCLATHRKKMQCKCSRKSGLLQISRNKPNLISSVTRVCWMLITVNCLGQAVRTGWGFSLGKSEHRSKQMWFGLTHHGLLNCTVCNFKAVRIINTGLQKTDSNLGNVALVRGLSKTWSVIKNLTRCQRKIMIAKICCPGFVVSIKLVMQNKQ